MSLQFSRFIFAVCIALVPLNAWAELRKPSLGEDKALRQYATVINQVLDHFQGEDWNERVDSAFDEDIMVQPDSGRPLDVNEVFQRSYDVRPGSGRFNRVVQPVIDKAQQEPDPNKKTEIIKGVQDQMRLRVEVRFNRENIDVEPPPAANTDLHLPGAAFAYKIKDPAAAHGAAYLLAFGNWSQLSWDVQHR